MTPPDFTITSTDTGRDIELAVTGELDILTTPHLVVAVEGTVGQHRDVVIDLADVTFIDSTAIQALVRGQRTLAANRQRLRLVNPATVVTRVLDLTGLAHHFAIDGRPAGTASADASGGERTLQVMLQELAQRLLTEQSLGGDLERLIRFTCTAIPACDAASIALLIDGQPSTVAVTEHVALELDIAQYDNDEGPCLDALQGHPIRVDLLDRDERFNHFAQGAASQAVNSVLSIPINHRDDIVGTLNLYARAATAFDDDDTVTAQIAATQAANAIVRSDIVAAGHRLRDQLQAVYDEATLTARAQGVLIGIEQCSAEQARHLLTHAANATGTSLAATAQRILHAARDQPPSTH